ncbi:hypothetical protein EVAR_81643_1 [Eumeta japonica]|uniref:Uncharacterized protein n=1 Tax=Eumeta variegata TaxID=151549 RepID=A0A4C1V3Q0_EUMVA|nr:hypothetical protein EVAR_81643_1 [Eumeta japonica]
MGSRRERREIHVLFFMMSRTLVSAEVVQGNFCQPSSSPLRRENGSASPDCERENRCMGTLLASNSTIDDSNTEPQPIIQYGNSISNMRFLQISLRRALFSFISTSV